MATKSFISGTISRDTPDAKKFNAIFNQAVQKRLLVLDIGLNWQETYYFSYEVQEGADLEAVEEVREKIMELEVGKLPRLLPVTHGIF